uniref:TPR repeat n=1 Tax=Solanum tuberosum TaxID=4113 RepID=M1DTK1_SOLTU
MVADSREKMSKFVSGVSEMLVKECRTTILIKEIDIFRVMIHAQQIEEDKLKKKSREAKRARTGDDDFLHSRYEEGAHQFRIDVAQNPNDTEESIWCFLCEAQLYGIHEARKRYLELVAAFLSGQPNEYFYASLYDDLYYESQNEPDEAKVHLIAACQSPYGSRF